MHIFTYKYNLDNCSSHACIYRTNVLQNYSYRYSFRQQYRKRRKEIQLDYNRTLKTKKILEIYQLEFSFTFKEMMAYAGNQGNRNNHQHTDRNIFLRNQVCKDKHHREPHNDNLSFHLRNTRTVYNWGNQNSRSCKHRSLVLGILSYIRIVQSLPRSFQLSKKRRNYILK